ncbi:MAG: 16S rRNA (adenine(1518)-N(6)/adenine(1519)-N(6))-dimethyltransferase RsmA [archaeon]
MIKDLYSQMLKYNFKPNIKFDQNFIINFEAITKVIKLLEISKEDIILEIGGGTGFLTAELLKFAKKVIVIEKDKKMCDILKLELPSEKLEIINANFLDVDLNTLKYNKIAGFIPYSISMDIIYKLRGDKKCVIVTQKEFAEKLASIEGLDIYKAISVITQSYFNIKIAGIIKKNCFFPVPSCESAIVLLDPKKIKFDETYENFIKSIFRHAKKNLDNAIYLCYKEDKEKYEKIMPNVEKISKKIIKRKVRTLTIEEIKKVYNILFF